MNKTAALEVALEMEHKNLILQDVAHLFYRLKLAISQIEATAPKYRAAQVDHAHKLCEAGLAAIAATGIEESPINTWETSIEQLGISVRSTVLLRRAGIGTVGKLAQNDAVDLLRIKGLGRKALDEITRALAYRGIQLTDRERQWAEAKKEIDEIFAQWNAEPGAQQLQDSLDHVLQPLS